MGKVTEHLLKELRWHNYSEVLDRYFSLGSHLNARDVKAVRKTVSGLIKLIYPHGEFRKEELTELLVAALEGRRRVKEQLKKMGPFEYHQTSFSYINGETREERYVGVPKEGGRALIPIENKGHFLEVSGEIIERVDPIFYGDPLTAAMKSLGLN